MRPVVVDNLETVLSPYSAKSSAINAVPQNLRQQVAQPANLPKVNVRSLPSVTSKAIGAFTTPGQTVGWVRRVFRTNDTKYPVWLQLVWMKNGQYYTGYVSSTVVEAVTSPQELTSGNTATPSGNADQSKLNTALQELSKSDTQLFALLTTAQTQLKVLKAKGGNVAEAEAAVNAIAQRYQERQQKLRTYNEKGFWATAGEVATDKVRSIANRVLESLGLSGNGIGFLPLIALAPLAIEAVKWTVIVGGGAAAVYALYSWVKVSVMTSRKDAAQLIGENEKLQQLMGSLAPEQQKLLKEGVQEVYDEGRTDAAKPKGIWDGISDTAKYAAIGGAILLVYVVYDGSIKPEKPSKQS